MPSERKQKPKLGKTFDIRFVPKTDMVVTLGLKLKLWRSSEARPVAEAHPFKHPACMSLSADGQTLAVKSTSGQIALLAMPGLALIRELATPDAREGSNVLFSPCDGFLVDGDWSGRLVVRSVSTGEIVVEERTPHAMHTALDQSADRKTFVYLTDPKANGNDAPPPSQVLLRRWPFREHAPQPIRRDWGWIKALAMAPDASRIAVIEQVVVEGEPRMRIQVSDVAQERSIYSDLFPILGTNASIAWSPDATTIGCVLPGRVCLLDAFTLREIASFEDDFPCFVCFSPHGQRLGIGSWKQGAVIPIGKVRN